MNLIEKVIACLPERGRHDIFEFLFMHDIELVTELRFRTNAPFSLTYAGRNICIFNGRELIFSELEMRTLLANLCEESVHTYAQTMNEGYITLANGARIGVCGHAHSDGKNILNLRDVTSICVRVPHIVRSVSDGIMPVLFSRGKVQSALIYSPPGVGKTTLLRDVAKNLSSGAYKKRVCVVDSRSEIYMSDIFSHSLCDFLDGYPKSVGIEIATRTLSPEVIICDEIGGIDEASAILQAQNSGVPLIATAHANDLSSLLMRQNIRILHDGGIFRYYIGLSRSHESEKIEFEIEDTKRRVS